jgi:hypothetical protein
MRLKSIGISNFKAFGEEFQTIPIKPITLVFGPNSAGKSSLLHSLLWLNHAESRGETDVFNPSLAGKAVNLGGFDSCLNRKSGMHRLIFAITIENPAPDPDSTRWLDTVSQFKLVFACERTEKDQPAYLIRCELFANDIKLLKVWKRYSSPSAGFDAEFEWSHPVLFLSEDEISHLESWCGLTAMYEMVSLSFLPTKVFLSHQNDDASAVLFGGFPKEGIPPELERLATVKMPAAVEDLFAAFRRSVQEIVYIPPIRVIPDRAIDLQSCELSGWRWLAKRPEICDRINDTLKNLGIDHQVKVRGLIPVDTAKECIIRTLAQAEVGNDWGGLSCAVENARETWEAFNYSEYKQWLAGHPALFKQMVDYWYDIIDSNNETFDYYQENPEVDKEEPVPPRWIRERAEEQAYSLLNDWGGTGWVFSDEAARLFISEDQGVRDAIMLALRERGLDKDLLPGDGHLQLRLYDPKRDVWLALQDVGVGVSQSLPIILEAHAQQNKLIAIEQPELHIHPRLQAELGDVFIESALGENKNTFLLETHSEHLILRILRRIRETTEGEMAEWPEALRKACPNGIRPEDVAVLYVQPGKEGAEVLELPVDANGEFTCDWPGGFFEERMKELF